jgi:hypothetical protein
MTRLIVATACLLAVSACVVEPEPEHHDRGPVVERQYNRDHYEDRRNQRRDEWRDERHDDYDHR